MSDEATPDVFAGLPQAGAQNPRVKQFLSVKRNTKGNPDHLTVLEGLWELTTARAAGLELRAFFVCPELLRGDRAVTLAGQVLAGGTHAYRVSEKVMAQLADRDGPDGLAAVAVLPRWTLADLGPGTPSRVVVLDGLEILGNVGTIARCADAVGADAVLLTNRRVRLTHPRLVHASMGASLSVPMVDTTPGEAAAWLREHGYRVLVTDTRGAVSYKRADYGERTAVVLGSERYGVVKEWYEARDQTISLPMAGAMDSLNVANAAVVVLFECLSRQRPDLF